jgi:hypothetical protein
MGKLVRLKKFRRPASSKPARTGEAQIVIFTGVRYERDNQPTPGGIGKSNGDRRKRG